MVALPCYVPQRGVVTAAFLALLLVRDASFVKPIIGPDAACNYGLKPMLLDRVIFNFVRVDAQPSFVKQFLVLIEDRSSFRLSQRVCREGIDGPVDAIEVLSTFVFLVLDPFALFGAATPLMFRVVVLQLLHILRWQISRGYYRPRGDNRTHPGMLWLRHPLVLVLFLFFRVNQSVAELGDDCTCDGLFGINSPLSIGSRIDGERNVAVSIFHQEALLVSSKLAPEKCRGLPHSRNGALVLLEDTLCSLLVVHRLEGVDRIVESVGTFVKEASGISKSLVDH